MAAIAFPEQAKSVTVPSGATYSYVYSPASPSKPTLLFLHGFPSSSYDWRKQISFFSPKGYGVVVPDLLGYGGSTKPDSPQEYRMTRIASDVIAILDHEKITKVHSVAHDFGCLLQGRTIPFYQDRFLSATFLGIPYNPPESSPDIDINNINIVTKQAIGFELFGYWKFFEREDSWEILKDHAESFLSSMHAADELFWKDNVCPLGAYEKWLKADNMTPSAAYITPEEIAMHRKIFQDDYKHPLNWYKAISQNVNKADLDEAQSMDRILHCPVLFVDPSKEIIKIPNQVETMRLWVDDLTVKELPTLHWLQLELPDETNKLLEEFFQRSLT